MSSMEAWRELWSRKLNPCDSVHLLYPIPRYWNEKRWKDIRYLLMWSCLREFFILKFGVQKGNMNAYVVFLDENCARSAANSCNGMNLTITYNRKIMITYPQGCFTRFRNWWRATKNPPKVKLCNSLRHCDGCKLSQRPLYILGYVAIRYGTSWFWYLSGNVPFVNASEDSVRNIWHTVTILFDERCRLLFRSCGDIENVRLVRDKMTGYGDKDLTVEKVSNMLCRKRLWLCTVCERN